MNKLLEVGTRYQHLADLRDLWAEGLEKLSHMRPNYRTKSDATLMANLEIAISFINRQLENLAEYDYKRFALEREVNAIPKIVAGSEEIITPSEPEYANDKWPDNKPKFIDSDGTGHPHGDGDESDGEANYSC